MWAKIELQEPATCEILSLLFMSLTDACPLLVFSCPLHQIQLALLREQVRPLWEHAFQVSDSVSLSRSGKIVVRVPRRALGLGRLLVHVFQVCTLPFAEVAGSDFRVDIRMHVAL